MVPTPTLAILVAAACGEVTTNAPDGPVGAPDARDGADPDAGPDAAPDAGPGALTIDVATHDVGVVDVGATSAAVTLHVTNVGRSPTGALAVSSSGDVERSADGCAGQVLAAGASCTLAVALRPAAHGARAGTVRVADPVSGGEVQSELTGVGRDFVTLTVSLLGSGAGTVTGAGLTCAGTTCTGTYARTTSYATVTLTAAPAATSTFDGWGGACAGTGGCTLEMDQPRTVTAQFPLRRYELTLTYVSHGGGAGTVSSNPAGLSCAGPCTQTATFEHGAVVSFTVAPSGGSLHRWAGACAGTGGCAVTMTESRAVTITLHRTNYVFITASGHNGNWGGSLASADAFCAAEAQAAGLPGTYVAWISNANVTAASRLGQARGWIRVDGLPFADTVSSLVDDHKVFYPVALDPSGNPVAAQTMVGTGTTGAGATDPNGNCSGWTTSTSGSLSTGTGTAGSGQWSNGGGISCAGTPRWYCFGTNFATPVTPAPATGRRAFMLSGAAAANEGLAGFDQRCQAEAAQAGLPNATSFKALVATESASAASRFDLNRPRWVRTDGIPVVAAAADLATGALLAPIAVAANGTTYNAPNGRAWGGAASASQVGTAATSCASWTATSGATATVGIIGWTTPGHFAWNTNWGCGAPQKLYCLED